MMPKRKGVLGESRQNFKKQFEPKKPVETKKRLTKLSERQETIGMKLLGILVIENRFKNTRRNR